MHFLIQDYCIGCIMESSYFLHGAAYWDVQFKLRLEKEVRRRNDSVQVIVLCCALGGSR